MKTETTACRRMAGGTNRVGLTSPDDQSTYLEDSALEGTVALLWVDGEFEELDREDLKRIHDWIGKKLEMNNEDLDKQDEELRGSHLSATNKFQSWDQELGSLEVAVKAGPTFLVRGYLGDVSDLDANQATALRDWLTRRLSETDESRSSTNE